MPAEVRLHTDTAQLSSYRFALDIQAARMILPRTHSTPRGQQISLRLPLPSSVSAAAKMRQPTGPIGDKFAGPFTPNDVLKTKLIRHEPNSKPEIL